jgi:Protein of unknown function (DUF3592)
MPPDHPAKDRAEAMENLPGSFLAELRALLAQGRQGEAIRRYALETGSDPAEAKAAVERIGRGTALVSLTGVVRILAAFFWLGAILAGVAAGWQAYDRHVVRRWPTVDAEVVHCSVMTHRRIDAAIFPTLDCQFRYRVQGTEHKARTTSSGSMPSVAEEAAMDDWVAHHPPGSRQAVHFDPENPLHISLGDADAPFQADTPARRLLLAALFAAGGVLFVAVAAWLRRRR